jgi:hypothetical protein
VNITGVTDMWQENKKDSLENKIWGHRASDILLGKDENQCYTSLGEFRE